MNRLNASAIIDPADFDGLKGHGPYSRACLANASARAADRARTGAKPHPATSEQGYTDEDRRFLTAVQDYQGRTGRKFLMATEYLAILKGLGYSNGGSATPAR